MVPAAAVILLFDARALSGVRLTAVAGLGAVLGWAGAVLVCAFYALVVWAYLRRGPATCTGTSHAARVVAVIATIAPFAFPLLGARQPAPAGQLAGDVLLTAGTAWAAWSLRYLGTNLSVIAQARGVADRGPYRCMRHPLYAGEIASGLGLALMAGSAAAFALWLALVAMQVGRARWEEQVLLHALPGYRDYRARTAALLPGVF